MTGSCAWAPAVVARISARTATSEMGSSQACNESGSDAAAARPRGWASRRGSTTPATTTRVAPSCTASRRRLPGGEPGALGVEPGVDRPVEQVHAVGDEPEAAQRLERRAPAGWGCRRPGCRPGSTRHTDDGEQRGTRRGRAAPLDGGSPNGASPVQAQASSSDQDGGGVDDGSAAGDGSGTRSPEATAAASAGPEQQRLRPGVGAVVEPGGIDVRVVEHEHHRGRQRRRAPRQTCSSTVAERRQRSTARVTSGQIR